MFSKNVVKYSGIEYVCRELSIAVTILSMPRCVPDRSCHTMTIISETVMCNVHVLPPGVVSHSTALHAGHTVHILQQPRGSRQDI